MNSEIEQYKYESSMINYIFSYFRNITDETSSITVSHKVNTLFLSDHNRFEECQTDFDDNRLSQIQQITDQRNIERLNNLECDNRRLIFELHRMHKFVSFDSPPLIVTNHQFPYGMVPSMRHQIPTETLYVSNEGFSNLF